MAVIVKHIKSGKSYVVVGTGFGAFKATKPNWFFGNLMSDEQSGELSVVAVCGAEGAIGWIESDALTVVSIDGVTPGDVLAGA